MERGSNAGFDPLDSDREYRHKAPGWSSQSDPSGYRNRIAGLQRNVGSQVTFFDPVVVDRYLYIFRGPAPDDFNRPPVGEISKASGLRQPLRQHFTGYQPHDAGLLDFANYIEDFAARIGHSDSHARIMDKRHQLGIQGLLEGLTTNSCCRYTPGERDRNAAIFFDCNLST